MRVPDNLDIYEMHEREQERRKKYYGDEEEDEEVEEELGFRTIDKANEEREED